jgi:hypothetical protein
MGEELLFARNNFGSARHNPGIFVKEPNHYYGQFIGYNNRLPARWRTVALYYNRLSISRYYDVRTTEEENATFYS